MLSDKQKEVMSEVMDTAIKHINLISKSLKVDTMYLVTIENCIELEDPKLVVCFDNKTKIEFYIDEYLEKPQIIDCIKKTVLFRILRSEFNNKRN